MQRFDLGSNKAIKVNQTTLQYFPGFIVDLLLYIKVQDWQYCYKLEYQ